MNKKNKKQFCKTEIRNESVVPRVVKSGSTLVQQTNNIKLLK